MRRLIIATVALLFYAVQSWADCAWVLIQQKSYPNQLLSDPYVSVQPHSYYENQKGCEEGHKTRLNAEEMVVGSKLDKNTKTIIRQDQKGREAYYTYDCIPSNVLSLYMKAER